MLYSGLVSVHCLSAIHVNPFLSLSIETPHLATSWGMAARSTIGQIQEFCPDSESFTAYVERVELFFTANDISGREKGTHLSQCCWGYYVRVVA